jgi:hypothetical protein
MKPTGNRFLPFLAWAFVLIIQAGGTVPRGRMKRSDEKEA